MRSDCSSNPLRRLGSDSPAPLPSIHPGLVTQNDSAPQRYWCELALFMHLWMRSDCSSNPLRRLGSDSPAPWPSIHPSLVIQNDSAPQRYWCELARFMNHSTYLPQSWMVHYFTRWMIVIEVSLVDSFQGKGAFLGKGPWMPMDAASRGFRWSIIPRTMTTPA